MQGACEGPGVQVAAGRAGDRGQAQSHLQSLLGSSEPQGRSGGAGLGGKCQAKQTVLEVKELKGCWYHNPQSLHLFLLFPKHDREQPALGGQRDNRTLLMQCCVW